MCIRDRIIGVDRPKVNTYVPGTDILDAETPQDSSVYLAVDQFKYCLLYTSRCV